MRTGARLMTTNCACGGGWSRPACLPAGHMEHLPIYNEVPVTWDWNCIQLTCSAVPSSSMTTCVSLQHPHPLQLAVLRGGPHLLGQSLAHNPLQLAVLRGGPHLLDQSLAHNTLQLAVLRGGPHLLDQSLAHNTQSITCTSAGQLSDTHAEYTQEGRGTGVGLAAGYRTRLRRGP